MSEPNSNEMLPPATPVIPPVDPLFRVLGWTNACLGGLAAARQVIDVIGHMRGVI